MRQDIEVPETILKKRKQNEKAREERLAAAVAARKVSSDSRLDLLSACCLLAFCMMHNITFRLAGTYVSSMLPETYHLSGLTLRL